MEEQMALWLYAIVFTTVWFAIIYSFYIAYKVEKNTSEAEFYKSLLWMTPFSWFLVPMALIILGIGGILYMCFIKLPELLSNSSKESMAEWTIKQEAKAASKSNYNPMHVADSPLSPAKARKTQERETIAPVKPKEIQTKDGERPSFKEAFDDNAKI